MIGPGLRPRPTRRRLSVSAPKARYAIAKLAQRGGASQRRITGRGKAARRRPAKLPAQRCGLDRRFHGRRGRARQGAAGRGNNTDGRRFARSAPKIKSCTGQCKREQISRHTTRVGLRLCPFEQRLRTRTKTNGVPHFCVIQIQ
jgi:hypothetical protein